ncbi:ABC transporter permease [Aminobacter sp. HY435]|uniref:ABC transporter permease n=1 Tax=Aminobacter sp. HY435 TaxID=2970917 RepID=UPI0022B9CA47|nr:ABC transporter permease subunit [Aminobacter sp. HY435]
MPRRRASDAGQPWIAQTVVLLIVAALVIGPLLMLFRTALLPENSLPFETWEFTLSNFATIVTDPQVLVLLFNTAVYALGSVVFGLVIATVLAWLVERTDMPGRTAIRVALFTWMAVPPVILGFGWILLINPGSGILNALWRTLAGTDGPLTIYSMWALIFITGISVTPTAFVMIGGLFRNMDPQLENAGYVHGGNWLSVARRITLPLLTPGLLSVGIYVFIAVVQTFELPLIVGLTARIPVLSTRIYLLSSPDVGVPNYGLSAAFGLLLLVVAVLLMLLYFRVVGAGEKYRVVSGKSFRPRQTELGRWSIPAMIGTALLVLLMILPLLVLLWTSFLRFYELPSLDALSRVSLDTYREVLARGAVQGAILNTVILVFVSSTATMCLAAVVAWFSQRGRGWIARSLDVLSFSPIAIPPIVMAMAILLLYLRTPLYGSVAILILGHMTIYLAFATRTLSSALVQLHKELADAAMVSGASWWTTLTRVIIPLIWPQALNGWIWVLAHSARDLTIPLLLMTNSNMVMSTVMWTLWDVPDLPGAAALSTLLVAALLCIVVPLQILITRKSERAM